MQGKSVCIHTQHEHTRQIIALLNLPIVPVNIVMKFEYYFRQWKICVHSDETSGHKTVCQDTKFVLVAPGLPIVPVKTYTDYI